MEREKNGFVISCMIDNKPPKANVFASTDLTELLNKNLKISKYSNKVKEIGLIFMAINPDTHSYRPDRKFWRWKRGIFDMYINVDDYQIFCKTTPNDARKTVAQLYLTGIETYLSKRKDIDHKKLYEDVKRVFVEKLNLNLNLPDF